MRGDDAYMGSLCKSSKHLKSFMHYHCHDPIPRLMIGKANIAPQGAPPALNLKTYIFVIIKTIK